MENAGRTENEQGEPLMKDTTKESSWSFRHIVILVTLCAVFVLVYGNTTLLASFFPTEAQDRGVSNSVVGIVFGSYSFTAFLFAPISGWLIPKFGARMVLIGGIMMCSVSLLLFSGCELLHSAASFAALSLVLRVLSATGAAASETSAMAIALEEFPNNLGTATGVMELFSGVGFAVGPAFGGFLYTAGGFKLPFIVFGSAMAAFVPILFFAYSEKQEAECANQTEENNSSMLQALKIPGVLVIALCYITAGTILGFPDAILGPHLRDLMGLNASHIGLIFLISSLSYAFLSPVVGFIGDKTRWYRWMIVLGFVGVGGGFIVLGPAPFLSSILPTRKVWLVCVAMFLGGTFGGCLFISLMPELKITVRNYGMPDNASTNGIISGIFTSMINLGVTIGPILGTVLYQHTGFQWATMIEGFICIGQAFIMAAYVTIEKLVQRGKSGDHIKGEKSALLETTQVEEK